MERIHYDKRTLLQFDLRSAAFPEAGDLSDLFVLADEVQYEHQAMIKAGGHVAEGAKIRREERESFWQLRLTKLEEMYI